MYPPTGASCAKTVQWAVSSLHGWQWTSEALVCARALQLNTPISDNKNIAKNGWGGGEGGHHDPAHSNIYFTDDFTLHFLVRG